MRLSRKAGLLAKGILWHKYECNLTYKAYYRTEETDWQSAGGSEVRDGESISGYRDYTLIGNDGRYFFAGLGGTTTIVAPNTGTVYRILGGETILEKDIFFTRVGYGTVQETHRKTLSHINDGYSIVYDIGDKIGSVRAEMDMYPDEENGYTYVITNNGYTIMTDGNGNYYAYNVTPRPEPAEFTAKIEDDVLVVRGNGVATIENGILYVR